MDRDTACKLFNMIGQGPVAGVDAEGNVVRDATDLYGTLDILGKPNYVQRLRLPDGQVIVRKTATGIEFKDNHDWATKAPAAFLREWADAMDPPAPHEEPTV